MHPYHSHNDNADLYCGHGPLVRVKADQMKCHCDEEHDDASRRDRANHEAIGQSAITPVRTHSVSVTVCIPVSRAPSNGTHIM
jgi:hypothetical protein